MKKKILITEHQMNKLLENNVYSAMVKRIVNELNKDYNVVERYFLEGDEYFNALMIEVNLDGQLISPKTLFEYLKGKYSVSDDFIKQVIRDWASNNIGEDYTLSKNVSLT